MSSWTFAARAAGLWRRDAPTQQPTDAQQEQKVLAPILAKGHRVSDFGFGSEASPDEEVRGVMFEPCRGTFRDMGQQPCVVVYCPSENTGGAASVEVAPIAALLLPLQIHVLAIDVSCSRRYCELDDVTAAVRQLRDIQFRRSRGWHVPQGPGEADMQLPTVALWGRSTGANAALRYARTDAQVAALVCDSAYSDLPSLLGLPSWLASPFAGLKKLAEEVAEFGCTPPAPAAGMASVEAMEAANAPVAVARQPPWELALRLWMPALYVHGEADEQVPKSCARELRNAHAGEAQLLLVDGATHDSPRPDGAVAKMVLFVHRSMQRPDPIAAQLEAAVDSLIRRAASKASVEGGLGEVLGPSQPELRKRVAVAVPAVPVREGTDLSDASSTLKEAAYLQIGPAIHYPVAEVGECALGLRLPHGISFLSGAGSPPSQHRRQPAPRPGMGSLSLSSAATSVVISEHSQRSPVRFSRLLTPVDVQLQLPVQTAAVVPRFGEGMRLVAPQTLTPQQVVAAPKPQQEAAAAPPTAKFASTIASQVATQSGVVSLGSDTSSAGFSFGGRGAQVAWSGRYVEGVVLNVADSTTGKVGMAVTWHGAAVPPLPGQPRQRPLSWQLGDCKL